MKYTCKSIKLQKINDKIRKNKDIITVTSTKNNTRISICVDGKLFKHTSSSRNEVYKGYESRLWIAIYRHSLAFGKLLKKFPKIRKRLFIVRTRGFNRYAIKGLLDSGISIAFIEEILNPPFNGCRKKKKRRL